MRHKYLVSAFMAYFIMNLPISAMNIEEGDYRIRCHTRNKGLKCLEAFPKDDVVRPRSESSHQDQKWSIKSTGNGSYRIRCFTKNGGIRYLEAFPKDDVVRPRAEWPHNADQEWLIKHIDNGYYYISCNTVNRGLRCLEAFPKDDVIRPREESLDQDQRWQFIKWK